MFTATPEMTFYCDRIKNVKIPTSSGQVVQIRKCENGRQFAAKTSPMAAASARALKNTECCYF
jgi:hypothetical protein